MGLDERRWQTLMINFRSLGLSANRQSSAGNEDLPAREVPSAPAHAPDSTFFRTELRDKLNSALDCLPERYQQVVKLYYEDDMTMKEIGTVLGVNESRVSQIHKAALAKMHMYFGGAGIGSTAAFC
jgi:RNA polymerase sigma factor for flagellar operon FliA